MLNPAGGFIGAAGLTRPGLSAPGRPQLVGLDAIDGRAIPEGSMLASRAGAKAQGHVSAAGVRLLAGGGIALGQLADGASRHGEVLTATSPTRGQHVPVRVVAAHFYDPDGERYRD